MSAYPPALRSVLKAAPSVMMLFASSFLFGWAHYAVISHPNDHVPRYHFRTHRLEKSLRYRENLQRHEFQKMLNYNPNYDSLV